MMVTAGDTDRMVREGFFHLSTNLQPFSQERVSVQALQRKHSYMHV